MDITHLCAAVFYRRTVSKLRLFDRIGFQRSDTSTQCVLAGFFRAVDMNPPGDSVKICPRGFRNSLHTWKTQCKAYANLGKSNGQSTDFPAEGTNSLSRPDKSGAATKMSSSCSVFTECLVGAIMNGFGIVPSHAFPLVFAPVFLIYLVGLHIQRSWKHEHITKNKLFFCYVKQSLANWNLPCHPGQLKAVWTWDLVLIT